LNGWIGGFDSILKRMTIDNFNWFLHVMLFYYNVLNKITEERKKKRGANNNDKSDSDNDDNYDIV